MSSRSSNGASVSNGHHKEDTLPLNGHNQPLENGVNSHSSALQEAQVTRVSEKAAVLDISKDLSALISQQMLATPDALALEDETTSLTYAELDQQVG